MTWRHVICAIVTVVLVAPGAAQARTVQQDLAVAQAYWHSWVCEGQWNVITDPGLAARGRDGEATGLGWAPAGWRIERCEFTIRPGLTECEREAVVRHEVGHFVIGPVHTGRMDPRVLDRVPCEGERLERAMRLRVKKRWRAAQCHARPRIPKSRIFDSTDWRAG